MRTNCLLALCFLLSSVDAKEKKKPEPSPIDRLIAESSESTPAASSGSTFESAGRYSDLFRDQRAFQKGDIVTVIVSEQASAVSKGSTTSSRNSEVNASIQAAGGLTRVPGPWSNLAGATSKWGLQGEAATTRETTLSTRLSARVIYALPNGNLIIEGSKRVMVNSEQQTVTVRGVLRWNDLNQFNTVSSDRLSDLEVRIEGRGVVQDAIRRPNLLYRILLGILPF
jgi:flagellar L-ring protein precursor FlgH